MEREGIRGTWKGKIARPFSVPSTGPRRCTEECSVLMRRGLKSSRRRYSMKPIYLLAEPQLPMVVSLVCPRQPSDHPTAEWELAGLPRPLDPPRTLTG